MRPQSGTPLLFTGLGTFNSRTNDGVVLHNITIHQLQDEVGVCTVFYLPAPALTAT